MDRNLAKGIVMRMEYTIQRYFWMAYEEERSGDIEDLKVISGTAEFRDLAHRARSLLSIIEMHQHLLDALEVGNHVVLINTCDKIAKGVTGTIISIDGNRVMFLRDDTKKEVLVNRLVLEPK